MPIYVHRCSVEGCSHQQEDFMSLNAPPPEHCGAPMVKVLQPSLFAYQTRNGNLYNFSVRDKKWVGGGRPKPKVIGRGHGMGGRRKPPTMERAVEIAGGSVVDPVRKQLVKGKETHK